MKREPRWEIVRTDAGWLARYIASNGKEVWRTSESYKRRRAAESAIQQVGWIWPIRGVDGRLRTRLGSLVLEVREVDER